MPAIRGITVAVGEWYARTLEIGLARNMRHQVECLVVTTPQDEAVKAVAAKVPGARVFETDAFTRPDAHGVRPRFNKGLALEEAFSALGRGGWLLIHDADVIFPDSLPLDKLNPEALHGARRRILEDPAKWHPGLDWNACPLHKDGGPVGFFQLAKAECKALRDVRPWYDVSFAHSGGGDAYYVEHWKRANAPVVMLPAEVLHLGPVDRNWFGTTPEAHDIMAKFVTDCGWRRAMQNFDPAAAARAGPFVERVEVPGYPKSTYELPFVRRAKNGKRQSG